MAAKRTILTARRLANNISPQQEYPRCASKAFVRSMATEAPLPNEILVKSFVDAHTGATSNSPLGESASLSAHGTGASVLPTRSFQAQRNPFLTTAQCTLYRFPSMEPIRLAEYPSTHLLLPTRRDILHKAVIYEGDMARQGTASTKWRSDVHGSGRKIRPQKGTGSARLGDKKSPMLRGGGVAFGPKPRDFSTELPRKIYDLAWRTALSYRYRKGELIVADSELDIRGVHPHSVERFTKDVLAWNNLGKQGGKTLFVTNERRNGLYSALEGHNMDRQGRALPVDEVDVKDLLEGGKVMIERTSLEWLFAQHESDLGPAQRLLAWEEDSDSAALATSV